MTDHYLLMTATPHKGDPKNFSLFLRLLDPEVHLVQALEQMDGMDVTLGKSFYMRILTEGDPK